MSFLFQKQDPLNLLPENGLSKPLGTFSENLSAAFESARANDQAYSKPQFCAINGARLWIPSTSAQGWTHTASFWA